MELLYTNEVTVFLSKLQRSTGAKVFRAIGLVEKYGQTLGMPYVKKVTEGIYELRIRGKQEVRLFFVRQQGRAIFLHGFIKKSQKTPQKELEVARNRLKSLT